MSISSNTPLKPVGLLTFLATGIIGWNLAAPPATPVSNKQEETKYSKRSPRSSRSIAADHAGRRVGSLRAIADPEARLLATIALANSLSTEDFAAWLDGGWFTLRGGPEHLLFNRILMERWRNEDPEGLLKWAAKNNNDAGLAVMQEWVENDPQRLIGYFKSQRDDRAEFQMLAKIAEKFPAVALARLQEMAARGLENDRGFYFADLMGVLAEKSPDALVAALDSLAPDVKIYAEGMLSKKRLTESFSEEIRNLWNRPDGWRIFAQVDLGNEITEKLIGEIANMPPEWRSSMVMSYYRVVNRETARKWLEADLEGAGFSPSDAKILRGQSLRYIASQNPETALEHLARMELNASDRRAILERVFSGRGDKEKLRGLVSLLPGEEERETAMKRLEAAAVPMPAGKAATTQDFLDRLSLISGAQDLYLNNLADMGKWDARNFTELSAQFKELPSEKKQKVALAVAASGESGSGINGFKGDAILYLLENPPPKTEGGSPAKSITASSAVYAVNLCREDPEAATTWVKKMPAGVEKSWTQMNVYTNWKQVDPKAAELWKKSLPADELNAMEKLEVRR